MALLAVFPAYAQDAAQLASTLVTDTISEMVALD
jgi:hypothetical protein